MNESLETWRRGDGWSLDLFQVDGIIEDIDHLPLINEEIPDPLTYEYAVKSLIANGYSRVSVLKLSKTLKQLREGLTLAEQALLQWHHKDQHVENALRVIGELMREVDFQRPTGPDGKHGKRHTLTCGCDRV